MNTPSSAGLTSAEAKQLLGKFGYDELPEKKRSPLLDFLSHFWGPIPWMIEAAALLSALVRHWADLIIILVLLLANAVVGFWEEFQAGNAIAALIRVYALAWFIANDRIKLVACRILTRKSRRCWPRKRPQYEN